MSTSTTVGWPPNVVPDPFCYLVRRLNKFPAFDHVWQMFCMVSVSQWQTGYKIEATYPENSRA